ncbi:uracil nucleotide/cysteinyl leukotriene receptor-like [Sylvia atricapilla]|uniref:uracil nucleotide/cysteinyl leukotriene receptor-like n=1 Tax=Sylvia atricapilla TaxID=48155 RepID=UPI003394D18D
MPNASSGGILGADFLISNGTNSLISNVTNASSGGILGADFLISNGTNFPISNMINASSRGILGADFQHFNGTNSLISNGTNSLISNMPNASSRSILGADFHHLNGTNSLISNMPNSSSGGVLGADFLISNGTNSLISNMINASSGSILGADFHHFNGTNSPIPNTPNSSSGGVSGADLEHSLFAVTYLLVLLLGLAANGLSLSLVSCRVKPLSHSYILLLQLALLDTLFLALLPLHIHSQLLGDTWSFGDTTCRVTKALLCLHTSLSVAFFSCLVLDVWLAALHPFTSIRLKATHYLLAATTLWSAALGAIVPLVLSSKRPRRCFGAFPESWAHPTAPVTVVGLVFGVLLPVSVTVLGLPLAAGGARRSGSRRSRRRALGTISIVLAICALCFLPQQLCQLLQFVLELQGMEQEVLSPRVQRVTEVLGSCSCCLKPILYRFHASSRVWSCPRSLRGKERVFTISGHRFGDPSWDCEPGQGNNKENPRGWKKMIHPRYSQS